MEEEKDIQEQVVEEVQTNQPLTKKQKREQKKMNKNLEREHKMKQKKLIKFVIWVGVGILIILGMWWLKANVSVNSTVENPIEITTNDWIKGENEDAVVTLTEYADFQCPACKVYKDVVSELSEIMGDSMRLVYKHFPLEQIHGNALLAAKASESAGKQGKFWEMHDILYARQGNWAERSDAKDKFVEYALELGLDKEQFLQDLNSKEILDKIRLDQASGRALNVQGTPTFFLNGKKIESVPQNAELFKTFIENSL